MRVASRLAYLRVWTKMVLQEPLTRRERCYLALAGDGNGYRVPTSLDPTMDPRRWL